jgi:hypothetical protein
VPGLSYRGGDARLALEQLAGSTTSVRVFEILAAALSKLLWEALGACASFYAA